jgi:hypothetical protein
MQLRLLSGRSGRPPTPLTSFGYDYLKWAIIDLCPQVHLIVIEITRFEFTVLTERSRPTSGAVI